MTVPGGCCSQGCHGYLLRSLAAPFCFIRHLSHTHLLFMGLKTNCCQTSPLFGSGLKMYKPVSESRRSSGEVAVMGMENCNGH